MTQINLALLLLSLSWPVLVAGYVLSWLVLRKRRAIRPAGGVAFVLISFVLFVAVTFAATLAWLPQFGPPTFLPYVYGPALVAAITVFPIVCWGFAKLKG